MKKTTLFISLVLTIAAITAFIYNSTSTQNVSAPPMSVNTQDSFIIGAIATDTDRNFTNLNALHLNLWHKYTKQGYSDLLGRHVPAGWTGYTGCSADTLNGNPSDYASNVEGVISDIYSNHGMKSYLQRPKIEWLCFGKRSDYECESAANVNADLFFYTFQIHENGEDMWDNSPYDNNEGHWVRHCRFGVDDSGYVVKRLKCNSEQSIPAGNGNEWQASSECNWIVKPRIRIDSNVAHDPSNPEVCRLTVIAGDSVTKLKEIVIHANDFLVDGNPKQFYNGRYLDEFNLPPGTNFNIHGAWGHLYGLRSRGNNPIDSTDTVNNRSKVDIKVKWLGKCDMWIDRIRVDDDVADKLFRGYYEQIGNNWLESEANIACSSPSPLKFYVELTWFNNIPCIAYVSHKLDSISQARTGRSIDMVTDVSESYGMHVEWFQRSLVYNAGHIKRNFMDKVNSKQILMECYPLTSIYNNSPEANYYSRIPNTLLNHTAGGEVWAKPVPPAEYDTWLQQNLDYSPFLWEPGSPDNPVQDRRLDCQFSSTTPAATNGFFRFTMQTGNQISRDANIPFIYMQQIHHWFTKYEVRREPTNEELTLLSNLAVSYGAKGIVYYWYPNHYNSNCDYSYGLTDAGNTPRHENVYQQNSGGQGSKFNTVARNDSIFAIWGPTLMSFDNRYSHSYIYYNQDERTSLFGNSFFAAVYTFKPGVPNLNCVEDLPQANEIPLGMEGECKDATYIQVATFQTSPVDINKYFMIVNRRCSPYLNESTNDNNGGRRLVMARFSNIHHDFDNYNNWNIYDVTSPGTPIATISITGNQVATLGEKFMPGEGRLFVIKPVLKTGGTLIADENISGETFTCEGTVYNNGHNITIGTNTHISFNDTSKIVMTGGTFTVGNSNASGSQNITFDSHTGSNWHGYDFNNCEVKIYNSSFSKTTNDTISAINLIDCPVVDIRGNAFSTGDNTLQGCINAVYYNYVTTLNQNFYIGGNTFNSNNSTVPAFSVSDYAGITMPVLIENNTFTSTSSGTTAILLSGITCGAVKSNTITDYSIGLNMLSASTDIFNNTISSSIGSSIGIYGTAGSELNMNASGDVMLGGLNNISFTANGSKDILVENSFFDICYGQNIFDVFDADVSKHLTGYFPYSDGNYKPDAEENCFKVNSNVYLPPLHNVLNGFEGQQIDISFDPYLTGCTQQDQQSEYIISLGSGIYDTVGLRGGGNGGGNPTRRTVGAPALPKGEGIVITTPKQMYDSICVQMRKHIYAAAKTKCFSMIDMFTDSLESLGTISKLYLAVIASDTSQSAAANLKTYYETLILNHASNVSIVRRCNYFVQKCKVKMHQYSSAMTGFNEIMNQNPYSYEGLLARWDYMATSLLINGQGGADNGISEFDKSYESDKFDDVDGDKSPFTKEQRSTIKQNVVAALETTKKRDTEKIKILQERSETGDETAKHELKIANTLKEIVKSEKPKNIIQHIKIVSGDLQKIFGSSGKSISKIQNSVPTVFKLYQNYPNPFNPVCVIKYDLPKDVKTVIKIYDILGRELKTLVNEFKKAGAYTVNFEGSIYASGVYFYRIEAGDFVESKKMVMVK